VASHWAKRSRIWARFCPSHVGSGMNPTLRCSGYVGILRAWAGWMNSKALGVRGPYDRRVQKSAWGLGWVAKSTKCHAFFARGVPRGTNQFVL
jgi:hypothetical protein